MELQFLVRRSGSIGPTYVLLNREKAKTAAGSRQKKKQPFTKTDKERKTSTDAQKPTQAERKVRGTVWKATQRRLVLLGDWVWVLCRPIEIGLSPYSSRPPFTGSPVIPPGSLDTRTHRARLNREANLREHRANLSFKARGGFLGADEKVDILAGSIALRLNIRIFGYSCVG